MASGAGQRIAEALAETGRDDRETALLILELAVGWAAGALVGGTPESGDDGAEALAVLSALDDALAEVPALAGALPVLLESARAGGQLRRSAEELTAGLAALAERVTAERERLDGLRAGEAALRARVAEHEELRREAAELERLTRLAAQAEALGAQRAEIGARLDALRARDPEGRTAPCAPTPSRCCGSPGSSSLSSPPGPARPWRRWPPPSGSWPTPSSGCARASANSTHCTAS